MMLPNENYLQYFPEAQEKPEHQEMIQMFEAERERCYMLRDFFEQMDYEFQSMSRREGNRVMNREQVAQMNLVLEPLLEIMKGEEYASFLKTIPEPREEETEGQKNLKGMTFNDVAFLMSHYRSAVNRFFQKNY